MASNQPIQLLSKPDRMDSPGPDMINILHLSDLHFGDDHDKTATAQRHSALDSMLAILRSLDPAEKPHIIVISGDLSCKGKAQGYEDLKLWLTDKLFKITELTPADCIICPGNHDVDRDAARGLVRRTSEPKDADELLWPEWLDTFSRHFHLYVKFADELNIPHPMLNTKPSPLVGRREVQGIQFLCLNSAWFCRDSTTDRGHLWIGAPQLHAMNLFSSDQADAEPLTIAVMHHPADWFEQPDCAPYLGCRNTYEHLATGSHIILSGHTHGLLQDPDLVHNGARLFRAGACYDSFSYPNNFSLLQLDPEHRTVKWLPWEYQPAQHKWERKQSKQFSLLRKTAEPQPDGNGDPALYLNWLREKNGTIDIRGFGLGSGKVHNFPINELYITLTTAKTSVPGEGRNPEDLTNRTMDLREAMEHPRLVVVGDPGSGKSTFLRRVTWQFATEAVGGATKFPIFIRVAELTDFIERCPKQAAPESAQWLECFLKEKSEEFGWSLTRDFFSRKLKGNHCVVLLDGLDEAPDRLHRSRVARIMENAADAWKNCQFVVTSRGQSFEGLKNFHVSVIQPLEDGAIETFLEYWCRKLYPDSSQLAKDHQKELTDALRERPEIALMAKTPVMLTALAVVHYNERRMPEQRAELYAAILKWLAEAREKRPGRLSVERCVELLRKLALCMQNHDGRQVKVELGWAAHKLQAEFAEHPEASRYLAAMQFLEEESADSGIIRLQGSSLDFAHLTFQEYLAALEIAGRGEENQKQLLFQNGKIFRPEWHEVARLLAGVLGARQGKEKVEIVVAEMLRKTGEDLKAQVRTAGLIGAMVRDLRPLGYKPRDTAYSVLHKHVQAIFGKGNATGLDLRDRVAAAEALDQADPSRLLLPSHDAYWISIPKGTLTTGDPTAYGALPKGAHKIPAFRIGKFPVTVHEYASYLADTGVKLPRDWELQTLHPGRPVVWVNWDQAGAYCAWVSQKWGISCKLPDDLQWEFAARGTASRIYPWGSESQQPDEFRANFNSMVGQPTPVGMFPDGDTPEGVSDMAGNVWEWTSGIGQKGKTESCVRGAAFYDATVGLRAAVRVRYLPGGCDDNLGFRCVRE